ncbi:LacI family DNA-binding transcriptional regulator [Dictyobacter aurantiacus]|nr:LacI family DNA-binding transcriptional regulator [Dictyobacter aurantiacus]
MATIYDLAKALGVSQTTVANALKGKSNVSVETRRRVLEYAQKVGYRPNVLARALTQRRTLTLAFMLPTIANPFYPEIAEEIECIARKHNYQVVFCNTHNDGELGRQYLDRLVSRWVDGVIVMGLSMNLADLEAQFQQSLPIVLCDWQENEQSAIIPQVSVDFKLAGQLAARHLLTLGHRRMAIIVDLPLQTLRFEGFRLTLEEAGLQLAPEMIQQGNSELASGYSAAQRLFALEHPPTAIFAANDWMAIGAMEAAYDMGLQVPRDVSIIGLDDIVVSAHMRPPLTTIAISKQQLAKAATELLLKQLNKIEDIASSVLVPPTLLPRPSTTVPPVDGEKQNA